MVDEATTDILLVDFCDSFRTTTAEILRVHGFGVVEADDGEIACELLDRRRFRLVLLDPDLPKRSGVEMLESIEALPPVLLILTFPMQSADAERIHHKVLGYLNKPVAPDALVQIVSMLLNKGVHPRVA